MGDKEDIREIDNINDDIKSLPEYDSNITYYINIGTISDMTYNIHSRGTIGNKLTESTSIVVNAKDDKQKYHYIIIPNFRINLKQLYESFKNKMSNTETHDIYVMSYEGDNHLEFKDFIELDYDIDDNRFAFFLKKKDPGDSKASP